MRSFYFIHDTLFGRCSVWMSANTPSTLTKGLHAVARDQTRVQSCGICGGQNGAGAGFLRVLRFPLLIFIPPISPQSPSPIIRDWYNKPVVAAVPKSHRANYEKGLHDCLSVSLVKCRYSTSLVSRPLPSKSFAINHLTLCTYGCW
jgi:hypothetical protein